MTTSGNFLENIDLAGWLSSTGGFSMAQMIIGGLVLVAILLYGISLGRTRALVSLLGIYIAFVFDATFVYLKEFNELIRISSAVYITRIFIFLVVYLAAFGILNRSLVKSRLTLREVSFFSVLAISILQLGLLVSIISNMTPVAMLSEFPAYFISYFANKTALFYWAVAPVVLLVFFKNTARKHTINE